MAIVSIHKKPKSIGSKKTFGELKVGDTYWSYLRYDGSINERTIVAIEKADTYELGITKIGGQIDHYGDKINVYYGSHGEHRNVLYKDSSITIRKDAAIIYATTKEELDEAIKYYS